MRMGSNACSTSSAGPQPGDSVPTDLKVKITLVNVEQEPILINGVSMTITRRDHAPRTVGSVIGVDFSSGPVTFSIPRGKSGPYEFVICAEGYEEKQAVLFADGPRLEVTLTMVRRPEKWQAVFTPWSELPAAFDKLRSILQRSPRVLLVESGDLVHLTEDGYDAMVSNAAAAAKAAMLNIYYELSVTYEPVEGARSFLSFVRSVEALGKNRLLAVVDRQFGAILATITQNPNRFYDWNTLGVDMPRFYLPPQWRMRIADTCHLRLASPENTLDVTYDSIRDTDAALATFAIVQSPVPQAHNITFQTFNRILEDAHPFDVHEWLIWSASGARPDLGYRLVTRHVGERHTT